MHYLDQDVRCLTQSQFSVGIGSANFLAAMAAAATEYASELAEYPRTQHEALANHYMSLRGMAALDLYLLRDLLSEHGPRGAIFGAWFAALSPHASYRQPLLDALDPRHRQHALHLALQAIDELDSATPTESSIALARIRSSLEALPRPEFQLRLAPSPEHRLQLEEERQRVAEIYRRDGAEAARDGLDGTMLAYFQMEHRQWRRLGCPSVERYMAGVEAPPA
ncbi:MULTISPECIES: hypothetical protein [unclassified Lysobacter]|uniref:hypothetical protein n=1 Tax=unclassified Lysobacter TaxID=2635362 RepID=UPI001BED2C43|nr:MULTISPECIES: hypothetical protein [unclassified Lysobacter]MBT2747303.1 hypothetical protein [Lysobacter sp. ISL-42]MBT2753348.1 hypothetical protein [Lysobacter sp. ISL-50]MBT2775458.1 hypothetical protein [Lysobacter sp. ISL-54]MBT2783006.1 hypothetical protein [Lysobacter sp. ISL-52]